QRGLGDCRLKIEKYNGSNEIAQKTVYAKFRLENIWADGVSAIRFPAAYLIVRASPYGTNQHIRLPL
ncbi:MAG: hypothetical protein WC216_01925, partial [Gallionella sp.]